jgi:hypothetical protein
MALSIEQKPLYTVLPIGQQVIFAVSDNTIVATKFKVKFIAEVHVSNTAIVPGTTPTLIGTFKTTPNNAGVGIFDLRPILETFVSPDYEPSSRAEYKNIDFENIPFPIHLIDMYSLSDNSIKYFAVRFKIEYSDSATEDVAVATDFTDSDQYTMFNGVLQPDDVLTASSVNYGYNLQEFYLTDSDSKFLTNAPTTQYARLTDYGTLPFLNFLPTSSDNVYQMKVTYHKADGSAAAASDSVQVTIPNGGAVSVGESNTYLNYFGAFPGNLQNWSTNFAAAIINDLDYYTIESRNVSSVPHSQIYTIKILCPNLKGYEAIRLTWLNQWGTWDYYTFNMKSTRTVTTNRTSYTQQAGTWNESTFKIKGYKGGKKNFRVNSTEKIKLNTDFVTEAEGVWFEELINSTDVYIVNGYLEGYENIFKLTNKYVEPVVLTTSSYVKKTIANDKVMQYTIEIEKSKMKRTQSV